MFVLLALAIAYFEVGWRRAANGPWVIFVHSENRDIFTSYDSHIPCLEEIRAEYKIDETGNLLVKQGQASKVSDSCS